MEQNPFKIPRQEAIVPGTVERYLNETGLSLEEIKGKTILDIGSAYGSFAREAKQKGILTTIVSIDRHDFSESFDENTPFFVADTQQLPFEENVFDYEISLAALPYSAHAGLIEIDGKHPTISDYPSLSEIQQQSYLSQTTTLTTGAIQECLRTLKPCGELRFSTGQTKIINQDIEAAIEQGVMEACKNSAHIKHQISENGYQIYIITKNHHNEEQELEPETN